MSTVNAPNPRVGLTVRVFDSFYDFSLDIPAAEYDVIYSFFLRETKTRIAAENFTTSLFRVAREIQVPPMTLLEKFDTGAGVALDVQMAYYLNLIRDRATLLGVGVPVQPNYYPARAVLQ